jgi:hypothetical protein
MLVSEFITAVQRQGQFTSDIASADILSAGNMEIQGRLVPLIRQSHQEYFVHETQVTSFLGRVPIPARAILGAVRHVQLMSGGRAVKLPQVSLEDDYLSSTGGLPSGWYFDGGAIVLWPRGSDATVRLRYYIRPGKMVVETDGANVAIVTSVTSPGGLLTLNLTADPSVITGLVDVVGAGSSHAHLAIDVASGAASVQTIPAASILSPVSVGDYVVTAGLSPVVPLPEELFSALVHQTAYVLLRALGYETEASSQKTLAEDALRDGARLLAPRSEGNPRRIVGGIRRALGQRGGW